MPIILNECEENDCSVVISMAAALILGACYIASIHVLYYMYYIL